MCKSALPIVGRFIKFFAEKFNTNFKQEKFLIATLGVKKLSFVIYCCYCKLFLCSPIRNGYTGKMTPFPDPGKYIVVSRGVVQLGGLVTVGTTKV